MTFHHEHRFIAHKPAGLTTAEKLLSCYVSNRIVEKTGNYSISVRRLCEALELSPSTVKRSLKGLEEKQIFTSSKSPISTYARTFSMVLQCPLGCPDYEDHHTKRELAERVNSSNRVKMNHLSGQNEPPYIDIEEEEDRESSTFEGQEELGLLVKILEGLKKPSKDQQLLKDLTVLQPKQLSKDLLQLVKSQSIDSTRRKKSYLEEVVANPSKKLLGIGEKAEALETAKDLLVNSPEDHLDKPQGYTAAHTPKRLEAFMEAINKTTKVNPYLEDLATAKTLTEDHFEVSEAVEAFMAEVFNSSNLNADSFENQFVITAFPETLLPVITPIGDGWVNACINLPEEVIKTLLETETEYNQYEARARKLEALKVSYLEANPKPQPKQFERSLEMGRFILENPLPIDRAEISKRFLNNLNKEVCRIALNARRKTKGLERVTYKDYLDRSFSIKEDLLDVAYWIPARPEGHLVHLRKIEKEYLRLRSKLTHQEIVKCLNQNGNITSGPEASQYAVSPEKYLAEKCLEKFRSKYTKNLEPLKVK